MTITEAAKTLNISSSKIYRYIRKGLIKAELKQKKGSVQKVKFVDLEELKSLLAL